MNPRYDKVAIFCETPFQLIVCLNTAVGYLHAKECVVFPVQDMYKSSSRFLVPPQPPLIRHVYPVRRTQASQKPGFPLPPHRFLHHHLHRLFMDVLRQP